MVLFIFAVQSNNVTEASLGYFIMPLVTVVWGLVLFQEKLSHAQWIAVLLAATAVLILTIGLTKGSWIALILAFSFRLLRSTKEETEDFSNGECNGRSINSYAVGCNLNYLLSSRAGWVIWKGLLYVFFIGLVGAPHSRSAHLFTYGALRVALSTAGILQYLNPSLQFFCAAVLFLEPLSIWHIVSFPIIWTALAIYSW